MLQAVEDIGSTKKRIKIEIPSEVIEREIKDSLERLRQNTKVPGFRPGKAPMNLIEKRFGKKVEEEVLERVISESYSRALREAHLTPVTTPQFDEGFDFKRNNPVNLSFTVEVMPKIDNLNYSETKAKDVTVTVDEAEIEDFIKRLQEEKAIYEVAEKEIGRDDLVTFEYVDCEIVEEETNQSLKEQISKMGMEILPLDIEERLMGKKGGEVIELTNTFDERFRLKELAGKTVKIKIMIKEVKRKILPEIDDEFAKDIGYENIQVLRENIKERIHKAKKEQASKIQKAEILEKIIESHDFEVPETLLRNELESLTMESRLADERYKMQDAGHIHHESGIIHPAPEAGSLEQEKEDFEKLQSELKQRALRNVKASIIIDAIGQKEGVTVTDDEVKDRIHLLAQRLSATPEALMKFYITRDGSLEGLRHSIYEDKVLDLLLSKAVLEKGPPEAEGE